MFVVNVAGKPPFEVRPFELVLGEVFRKRVSVKRCILLLLSILSVSSIAWADGGDGKSAKQPIGIFTDDNGDRIVVGIGTSAPLTTLDVSRGEIKLGSTGAACTKTLAGTLRYAASRLQFCDGTGWRDVSLDRNE
jgi:hypothetical protein